MLSRYFIARPIFACVCAAFIVIAGLVAMSDMARTQWPNIQPREIRVSTFYPGANAETLASTVAAPLEQVLASTVGLLYVQSTSAGNGQLVLRATFDLDADIDVALLEVNSRVQRALSRLPDEVRRQPITVSKATSSSLLIASLTSPDRRFDLAYMSNYARLNIVDALNRVPGVSGVGVNTMRYYSMRIWLHPDKLARMGLTSLDVLRAVREQNSQFTAGRIGEEPLNEPVDFTFTVNVPGRLSTPEQFGEIVLRKERSGALVKLRDVARVELGANRYDTTARLNGEVALPLNVQVQNDANAIEAVEGVRARLEELSKSFPEGLTYSINYDSTVHIRNAINEVTVTLFEALALVFAVVFLFMGSWRATLIPMLAVPVSIIGAFAVMHAMSFTVNIVTLFGMVFAIGIVVDDAIVVMENVQRIMQSQGLDARAATEQAMREVTRPVVAIVLVLVAVFMPVAFMGGLTGTIYRQFAVTIAGSVTISGIVALTLTPALCATLLRSKDVQQRGFAARFHSGFLRLAGGYSRAVEYLSRQPLLSVAIFVATLVAIMLLAYRIPTSLVPREDRAIVYASPILPDAASLSRSQAVVDQLTAALRQHPAVRDVIAFAGVDGVTGSDLPGGGNLWIMLKPWDERRGSGMSPGDVVEYIEKFGSRTFATLKSWRTNRHRFPAAVPPAESMASSNRAVTAARKNSPR
jgi:hydrophobe/amphiphile efflux-1 (HAE1) family protein